MRSQHHHTVYDMYIYVYIWHSLGKIVINWRWPLEAKTCSYSLPNKYSHLAYNYSCFLTEFTSLLVFHSNGDGTPQNQSVDKSTVCSPSDLQHRKKKKVERKTKSLRDFGIWQNSGSNSEEGKDLLSSAKDSDILWGPLRPLFGENQKIFRGNKITRDTKMVTLFFYLFKILYSDQPMHN